MNLRAEDLRAPLEQLGLRADGLRLSLHSSSLFPLYLVETGQSRFALKGVNGRTMGNSEADGLRLLRKFGARTPTVHGVLDLSGSSFLLMDFIETGAGDRQVGREDLISGLSRLYSHQMEFWGGTMPNFIGTLQQPNHRHADFESFWWTDRIWPMLERAQAAGHLKDVDGEQLRAKLAEIIDHIGLAKETPRPIHGDLWSGNVLFSHGEAWLIDPSVGFSCPQQDFAMLELFGSPLGAADYRTIAMQAGFHLSGQSGTDFFQLYPLLVHVRIFGGAYEGQTRGLIRRLAGF